MFLLIPEAVVRRVLKSDIFFSVSKMKKPKEKPPINQVVKMGLGKFMSI